MTALNRLYFPITSHPSTAKKAPPFQFSSSSPQLADVFERRATGLTTKAIPFGMTHPLRQSEPGRKTSLHWQKMGPKITASIPFDTAILEMLPPKSKVLDLGCGAGATAFLLANDGHEVIGIDFNPAGLREAQKALHNTRYQEEDCNKTTPPPTFLQGDATRLPFANNSFDAITCQGLFSAIPSDVRQKAFKEAARVLKPGGKLIILDFLERPQDPIYQEKYNDGQRRGYPEGDFPVYKKDRHGNRTAEVDFIAHHFSPSEIEALFRNAGLSRPQRLKESLVSSQRSNRQLSSFLAVAEKP